MNGKLRTQIIESQTEICITIYEQAKIYKQISQNQYANKQKFDYTYNKNSNHKLKNKWHFSERRSL